MHIPDGYLSPQTYVPFYAVFIVMASTAVKKVKRQLSARIIPFLGMAAAFSFLIMMFNIPIPGGTTGHAVGAAVIALIFGPWIASVAVSVAIIIQAFVFGDGGITALGANCINIAFVMSFTAWGVYKLVAGKSRNYARINIAAFLSGYISLTIAAVLTAVELGIQPLIAASADGTPLYAPYPLKIAIPAMALEHLLLFGIVEGLVTLFVFRYFYANQEDLVYVLK
ncbi:MAG TPA: cobalt transporter CbiM [Bacteroidales bacterium]|nr:cobalt transporter CbiM [Bacteroidales bacterium]